MTWSHPIFIGQALTTVSLFLATLAGAIFSHAQPVPTLSESSTEVETETGRIQGTVNATTLTYLGIPFAEPPVGKLRWRPPEPRRPWEGVLEAKKFGSHCIQSPLTPQLGITSRNNAAEDCLYLNVYVPRNLAARNSMAKPSKPVMVWIYGGANAVGASDFFDPTPLVETGDVIVVTLNYRVGPFGFLAHPALDNEGHPAVNYGVMDQQLALKWVRTNIGRFGGDSRNVTIFGLSAGGLNVTTHLVSPLSADLFDKAIIQSGSYQLDTPSLAESETLGLAFANRVGCKDQEQAASCLRALSTQVILAHTGDFTSSTAAVNQSTVDGRILPKTQRAALEAGEVHRVPVLVGSTSDEDQVFGCGALTAIQALSRWVTGYAYEFSDAAASPTGASHAADTKYLFVVNLKDLGRSSGGPDSLPSDSQRLAHAMRLSWAAFARTGSPRTRLIPNWPIASEGIQRLEPTMPSPVSQAELSARLNCATLKRKSVRAGN